MQENLSSLYLALVFTLGAALALAFLAVEGLMVSPFGTTLAARCALIAGMFLFVRWGSRSHRAQAGLPLLCAALWLAALPWLVSLFGPLGGWAAGAKWPALIFLLRFLFSLVGTALPGWCLGAALARLLGAGGEKSWRMAALQTALLSAGGAFGAVLGGFQLLPWMGHASIALASSLLLFATAVLAALTRPHSLAATGRPQNGGSGGSLGLLLWGLASLSLLLAWERALVTIYGPFSELFPRCLGLFLSGCAFGGLLVAVWPYPTASPLRVSILALLSGLGVGLGIASLNHLPLLFLSAVGAVPVESPSFSLRIWAIGSLLTAPGSVALGALLPTLISRARERASQSPSPETPWLADVAGGAVLAAPLLAFFVMPHHGFEGVLGAVAALLLSYAALEFVLASQSSRWKRIPGLLLCLGGTVGVAWQLPHNNPKLLSSGVYRYWPEILDKYKEPEIYRDKREKADVPYFREGSEAMVAVESVVADPSPILAVTVEGTVAATSYYDLIPQVLSVEIPMLLRPDAQNVLLAGYGSGVPVGSLLLYPLRSLEVAEPEEAVVEASRQFEPANRSPRGDPRLKLWVEDPRQVLLSKSKGTYDVIISRPSLPESASGDPLLTKGFFSLAATRLKEGGLFAQVVPLQGLDEGEVASLVKSVQDSFKDVVVVQDYYFELILLASDREIQFDLPAMQRSFAEPKIASDLTRIGVTDPELIVVRTRLVGKPVAIFAGRGRLLTDRNAPLAWSAYRSGGKPATDAIFESLDRVSTGLATRIAHLPDGAEGNSVLFKLAEAALAGRDAVRAADLGEALIARGDASDGHQVLGDACAVHRDQLKAVEEWHLALTADPKNFNALMSLADFNADRSNYQDAESYLSQALKIRPGDPSVLFARGRAFYFLKRYKESEADLAQSLEGPEEKAQPVALYYLGLIQKEKGNYQGAAEFLRRYLQWGYSLGRLTAVEADVHLALADVYTQLKLPDLADQQRKAGEALKTRLAAAASAQRKAVIEYLQKP